MVNDSIPTPESLFFHSAEGSEELERQAEQSAVILLEQEVQKQIDILSDGDKVLETLFQALIAWKPSMKIVEVKISKGLLYYSHHHVTATLKDRGWEIQEPYQNIDDSHVLLRVYPNRKSRKILRSVGVQISERDYPNNSLLSKLLREMNNSDAIGRPPT